MAPKRRLAVAAEAGQGQVLDDTPRSAGCMLYLYGESGTTYLYIHLNNDLTTKNDNRASASPGVSYAHGLKDGAQGRGRPADRLRRRLGRRERDPARTSTSRCIPDDGAAVDPYPYLQQAKQLLFSAHAGTPFTLALRGTVVVGHATTRCS